MDHSEFFGLTEYLTVLYDERFPPLTAAMAASGTRSCSTLMRRWCHWLSDVGPGSTR